MHDLIGDIHGHADALERLLGRLGYERRGGTHRHPERIAIFLGDYIDRGPRIADTLRIVRRMVDAGAALAIMGNHELNALAFHTPHPDRPGDHLRSHNESHSRQHAETMRQLSPGDLAAALEWFRTLPMWLDLDGLRAVHACWDDRLVGLLRGPVDDAFLASACLRGGLLNEPVEAILKGKDMRLPPGVSYTDRDGLRRTSARVRWYAPPEGHTCRTYAMASEPIDSDAPLPAEVIRSAAPYAEEEKPVFVGHYWLQGPRPLLLRDNVACLDWSVARGGFLCAYRWDGERVLDPAKFVWDG